jgi:ATP-binding cassette subfamily B protein
MDREVEALLAQEEDVLEVRASALTGRLLVRYRPALAEAALIERVRAALAAALERVRARALELAEEAAEERREARRRSDRLLAGGGALVAGAVLVGVFVPVSPVFLVLGGAAVAIGVKEVSQLVRAGRSLTVIEQPSSLVQTEVLARPTARRAIVIGAAFGVLATVFSLSRFLVIGSAVNLVVRRATAFQMGQVVPGFLGQMLGLAGTGLLLTGFQALCEYAGQLLWRTAAQSIRHRLQIRVYNHAQRLQVWHFEGRERNAVLSVLYQEIRYVESLFGAGWELLRIGANTVLISIAFFVVAPEVAWIAILTIPLLLRSSSRFQRRILPLYQAAEQSASLLSRHLTANLEGIVTIKSFTAEETALARVRNASRDYWDRTREADQIGAAFTPLIELETMAGTVATMVGGGVLITTRQLSTGTYASLIMLMGQLFWPLTELGRILDTLQRAVASSQRVQELLALPPETQGPAFFLPQPVRGEIEFRDVHFAYGGETPVLAGLTFKVEPGASIAVVGATGSGKSTLVKLLLRFYDVGRGSILLDGEDIRNLNVRRLRQEIGVVTQDTLLFPGSVRENIALGNAAAGPGEVAEAAQRAGAYDFIEELPHGFDTRIGERGETLSGGQRQRLAIARTFLRDPAVLVLDEATSHVDNRTEAFIQGSLRTHFAGRTQIIIAHRLSAVRHVDRIFVMDGGRIQEQGRHEELLKRRGIYAALWRLQTGARGKGSAG